MRRVETQMQLRIYRDVRCEMKRDEDPFTSGLSSCAIASS